MQRLEFAAWAILFLHRPNRTLLIAGAVGNGTIIALWTVTRTVGLPVGPEPWQPEAIAALDVLSTLCEVALVFGATILLARNSSLARTDIIDNASKPSARNTQHSSDLEPARSEAATRRLDPESLLSPVDTPWSFMSVRALR